MTSLNKGIGVNKLYSPSSASLLPPVQLDTVLPCFGLQNLK